MNKIDIDKIEHLESNSFNIEIGNILQEAIDIFKNNSGLCLLSTLAFIAATVILGAIPVVGSLAYMVLMPPVLAGAFYVVDKLRNNESVEKEDFFIYIKDPLHFFLGYLVSTILTAIGFMLCILPGIFLSVCYVFTLPILMDMEEKNFWEAMEASRKLVMKNWLNVFLFCLVVYLLILAGALLCGVGVLFASPVALIMIKLAYSQIKDQAGLNTTEPSSDYLKNNDFDNRY